MIEAMSLWIRWWVLFPLTNLVGVLLLFAVGYGDWTAWPQVLAPIGLLILTSRIAPEIMWDGDPKPPLRRRHDAAPSGRG
jgi:hypothetical protein